MIVDSSAVIAILLKEPVHEPVLDCLKGTTWAAIGAPTVVETSMVLSARLGPTGKTLLARFVQEAQLSVVDFTSDHWALAADAFLRYGKSRHPAGLNFGDCLTYAVSKLADAPLLCIGDDFAKTDLTLALDSPPSSPPR